MTSRATLTLRSTLQKLKINKAHQLVVTDGTTAFERCSGEPPRIVNASLSAPGMDAEDIEGCIERMNGIDANLVSKIYSRYNCNSMMEFKAIQSDKRARYNRTCSTSQQRIDEGCVQVQLRSGRDGIIWRPQGDT